MLDILFDSQDGEDTAPMYFHLRAILLPFVPLFALDLAVVSH